MGHLTAWWPRFKIPVSRDWYYKLVVEFSQIAIIVTIHTSNVYLPIILFLSSEHATRLLSKNIPSPVSRSCSVNVFVMLFYSFLLTLLFCRKCWWIQCKTKLVAIEYNHERWFIRDYFSIHQQNEFSAKQSPTCKEPNSFWTEGLAEDWLWEKCWCHVCKCSLL